MMCSERMAVSRDEAKRILRRLELEAYSSIISVFRAQGDLNRDKKRLLTELGLQLSISTERHRAEIRRAYSDDRLGAVADCIYGPSTCAEWAAEGRRLVPLMPRLVPQTVLTATATAAANSAAVLNAKLPPSSQAKIAASSAGSSNAASNGISSAASPTPPGPATYKASALKVLTSPQGSQAVDHGEFEVEDGKSKKRRRLSQSITTTKPVPKMATTATSLASKANMKTTSVSTMTKGNKPGTSAGVVKVPPKVSLPASASQVKLLTKTVAITQTICQAKTMLNYKTVSATSPAAVKVQTVTSHTAPKAQFKVAVPSNVSPAKTLLVPKAHASTSPGKPSIGLSLPKTGMTTAQILAKQRIAKQAARFKPLPGTVKFKSVTPATMGTGSTVTMVSPSPSAQASPGTTISTLPVSSTQPIVKIIQVPGTGGLGISKPVVVMTTGLGKASVPGALPVNAAIKPGPSAASQGISAFKIPISSTSSVVAPPLITMTTQASRPATTAAPHLPASAAKTIVMTTMVDGTKKVVLSLPAPVLPIHAKSFSIPSTTSSTVPSISNTQGLGAVLMSLPSTASAKPIPSKPEPTTLLKKTAIPSLECTEPSSVLQGPTPIAPKPSPAPTLTTQVRTRPLPAILPAPPKPTASSSISPATTSAVGRKLPHLLPAPVKSVPPPAMLVPMVASTTPIMSTVVSSHIAGTKVMKPMPGAKSTVPVTTPPPVNIIKAMTVTSTPSTSTLLPVTPDLPGKDMISKVEPDLKKVVEPREVAKEDKITGPKVVVIREDQIFNEISHTGKVIRNVQMKEEKLDGDSYESSEDESIDLVCSETIDVSAGLQPELSSGLEGTSMVNKIPAAESKEGGLSIQSTTSNAPNVMIHAKESASLETKMEHDIVSGNTLPGIPAASATRPDAAAPVASSSKDTHGQSGQVAAVSLSKKTLPDSLLTKISVGYRGEISGEVKKPFTDNPRGFPDFAAVSSFLQSFSENPVHKSDDNKPSIEQPSIDSAVDDAFRLQDAFPERNTPVKNTNLLPSSLPSYHTETPRDSQESPESLFGLTSSSGSSEIGDIAFALDPNSSSSDHSLEGQNLQGTITDPLDINVEVVSLHSGSSLTVDDAGLTESERQALEAIANVRTSGRKRKAPVTLNVSPPRQSSGWSRGALSLLQKVSSYRGQGRRKGDISAASWFVRPVDQNDAPGYFKVIKTPMDFSTIKTKLEAGMYEDYNDFHYDMLLVKSNCFKYNPPGHDVRNDCDEVFKFYDAEYTKMLERWEKCHVSPAKKSRPSPRPEVTSPSL